MHQGMSKHHKEQWTKAYHSIVKHSFTTKLLQGVIITALPIHVLKWLTIAYDSSNATPQCKLHSHIQLKENSSNCKFHRALLDQALKTYGDRYVFKPEKARAIFKRSKVLRLLQREDEAEAALNESWKLYQEIRPADQRTAEQLCDTDFDKIVVFWSR